MSKILTRKINTITNNIAVLQRELNELARQRQEECTHEWKRLKTRSDNRSFFYYYYLYIACSKCNLRKGGIKIFSEEVYSGVFHMPDSKIKKEVERAYSYIESIPKATYKDTLIEEEYCREWRINNRAYS